MKIDDIYFKSAVEISDSIKRQEMTAVEITEAFIERIEKINPIINAYCTYTFNMAREQAKNADETVKKGKKIGLLNGIPTSIKDLASLKGVRTTFGSKLFENYIPDDDSIFVKRLKDAGCVILGKTNTPEFGFKGATDNLIFGASKNPWKLDRTTGGSSGGAAAAVASGLGPLAQGSDGGGSIRHPACFCGVYGLKPTFGRVPIYPRLHIFAETLSVVGPIVRYVEDAALMLDAIKGPFEGDRFSLPRDDINYLESIKDKPNKLRIGYSLDLGYAKVINEDVKKAFFNSVQLFEKFGWSIQEIKIKLRQPEFPFYTIWSTKIAHFLKSKLNEWREKMDPELVKIIELGLSYDGNSILKAMNDRRKIYDTFYTALKNVDILLTPSTAVPAFGLGMMYPPEINGKAVSPTGWQPFSFPFNMTGHPAATIPCGWSTEGLPIGLQIVGKRFDEALILQVSKAFEEIAPWQDKKPNFN